MEQKLSLGRPEFLDRILGLYKSGLSSEEIATRILTNDAETTTFRVEALVEMVIQYANRDWGPITDRRMH